MCFLRIDPESAPINPPGAAPTLTTIYDEAGDNPGSEFSNSPSNSLSKTSTSHHKDSTSSKDGKKASMRKKSINRLKGSTKAEKKRTQTIADSLDLPGVGQPNRVVGVGDERLEELVGTRRASIGMAKPAGKKRAEATRGIGTAL
ncbi:hypothetical protein MMC28_003032 [Mycoblastus sanguinarius]|nr:hypothetical protein [Mycoblastus sanguinarius]